MLDMINMHTRISLAVTIVLFILITLFLPKILHKMKNKRIKSKEKKKIIKDLLIWKRIANLAKGGSESEKTKAGILHSHIHLIEESFDKLKHILKYDFKTVDDAPWYIAVGEKFSGKSTLIENSVQDMISTESDEVVKRGFHKSSLLKFWVGSSGIVADVSGKVFFDRWLGGSGAEWISIIKQIRKKHKKTALSGVILTIPADSLIADDESLTKRKAVLIKTGLNRMINILGMQLPCYVVITKSDIISGFREYFENIDENVRKAYLGWKSSKPYYDDMEFSNFWESFINNLRNGRNHLLLTHDIFYTKSENGRMDKASKIYLFAEAVNDLLDNIEIYMKTIFGSIKRSSFLPWLMLDGIYFTSAGDSGYTLNKFFAKMQNKKIDDAQIAENAIKKRGFFISDLFLKNIFVNKNNAVYTSKEMIRRNIPHYTILGIMLFFSLLWIFAVIFQKDNISEQISSNLAFYNETADIFANKSINNAYLISMDREGKPVYNGEDSMPNDQFLYRQSYYITALKDAQTNFNAPFGFQVSSIFKFGTTNLNYYDRLYLFELIHSRIVSLPLLRTIEASFINDKQGTFTLAKRKAFFSLTHFMDESKHYSMEEERESIEVMIRYLFPDMHDEIVKLLVSNDTYSTRNYESINDSVVIHKSYFQAIQAGMKQMLNGWDTGNIYQDCIYNVERNLIHAANKVEEIVSNTVNYELQDNNDLWEFDTLKEYNQLWTHLYDNISKNIAVINNSINQIKTHNPKIVDNNSGKNFISMLSASYGKYIKLFNEDFAFINKYNNRSGKERKIVLRNFVDTIEVNTIKENTITSLENDFNSIQLAVTNDINKVFTNIEIDNTFISYYNFLFTLFDTAYNKKVSKISKNQEMTSIIHKYNQSVKNKYDMLSKYIDIVERNENFTKLVPVLKSIHSHTYQYNNIMFVKDLVSKYPATELGLMVNTSSKYGSKMSIPMPQTKYVKPLYKPEYNTNAVNEYINPFWNSINEINQYIQPEYVNYLSTYLSSNDDYLRLYNIVNMYTSAFIRYWGSFGDSILPEIDDYETFYKFISELHPYIVNNELYEIYTISNIVLNMLPENEMPLVLNREKLNFIKANENKANGIDTSYNDVCNIIISNWKLLPENAASAKKVFTSMNEHVIKQKYLTLSSDINGYVKIPWWENLFKNGAYLITHNGAY